MVVGYAVIMETEIAMLNINTQVIEIPKPTLANWQQNVAFIADSLDISATIVLQIYHSDFKACASSKRVSAARKAQRGSFNLNFFSDHIVNNQTDIFIEHIAESSDWRAAQIRVPGIQSFFGWPINWPNGQTLGCIYLFDEQPQKFNVRNKLAVLRFQQAIESDLAILFQHAELIYQNRQLKTSVAKKNLDMQVLKQELHYEQDSRFALESSLIYQQDYDLLTGVANQVSFVKQVDNIFSSLHEDDEVAVIYLGLRNFKSINNSYGYDIGDRVLLETSQRIHQQLTTEYLVARCWGDAFAIAVRDENAIEQTIDLISRLINAFEPVFEIKEFVITAQVCFGIALGDSSEDKAITLLEKSEAAMTACKDQGMNYKFFTQEIEDVIGERHHLESHLASALYNNEMSVHYQPMMCTKTGDILGAEALIRWNNPVLGAVAPDRFINLAEQNGQILALGNFVLRTAIEQAVSWRRKFGGDFCIAVNMSPVQFRDEGLVKHIQQLLSYYQLPAQCLELEITEGVLLQDEAKAGKAIQALQALGIKISLDDFGTGYASMSYLQKYSFDTLKIDRSFINNLNNREQDRELVRAMIAMAKKLNLRIVAEGVETQAQHDFITNEQCDFGQGYLYGKPAPAALFAGQYLVKKAM